MSPDPDDSRSSRPRGSRRTLALALAAMALVLLVFTKDRPGSWADASRLATIESLVERGTLAIDGSTYEWQGDKVRFGEHFYSHQPPMQALLGAAVYAPLHKGLGWTIDEPRTYRAITWGIVGLPVLLGLYALLRLCLLRGVGPLGSVSLVALAFLATPLLPYSLVLNQHGTAAGFVAFGFYAVHRRWFATAGLALALAATIDLTAAFPAAALVIAVLFGGGLLGLLRYAGAALPVLVLHFSINNSIAGDLLPFGMHAEAFRYGTSPFVLMSLTGVAAKDAAGAQAAYLWEASFGGSGVFSHHPLLLVAIAAAIVVAFWRTKSITQRFARGLGLSATLTCIGIAAYYLTSSRNLGGSSFGIRWFTVFIPLLVLGPAALIANLRVRGWVRPGAIGLIVLGVLALWSSAAASLGAVNPWTKVYYSWESSPVGRVAQPGDPRPATRADHLASEWARIQSIRPINAAEYNRTYSMMLDQLRKAYLRPAEELGAAGRAARARLGVDKLQPAVDLMDAEEVTLHARPEAHFWLGKLLLAAGDDARGKRELEIAALLDPTWPAPREALERLGTQTPTGDPE